MNWPGYLELIANWLTGFTRLCTNRTKPIGFLITDDKSWVNQQYKLINDPDNSIWELYDLLNIPAGEECEQTPLATVKRWKSVPSSANRSMFGVLT